MMKKFSERGQGVLVFVGLAALVAVILMLMMAGNQRNMQEGAETIGETVGDAIDNATRDQDFENPVWQAQNAVAAHVGTQRALKPNQHAIDHHGNDAWATVDCYNRNGTFHVMRTMVDGNPRFHLLCNDNGTIRDMILKQRGNNPNEFEIENAFTPQDGSLRKVLEWIGRKTGAIKFKMPENSVIYSDGVLLP
jgi:hypothetical protein